MATATEIWQACEANTRLRHIDGLLYRIVESQAQVATTSLVAGDLQKQAVLERLLEESKPPRVPGTQHLHYLLATPWRYPPLRHGSRYGSTTEPSLFYGGLSQTTTLSECAYYRLVFFFDMDSAPQALSSRHTLFEAEYHTDQGLVLHQSPFTEYRNALINRANYATTQALGTLMRNAGVCAFEFPSARDCHGGNNVALIDPSALSSKQPLNPTSWLCSTNNEQVVFSYRGQPGVIHAFRTDSFFEDGAFPRPA